MAEQLQEPAGRKIRPTVMIGGGNGDTTFVDVRDLHPENEATAALSGGAAGAVVGGGGGALLAMALNDAAKVEEKNKNLGKYAIIGASVTAALGAVVGYLNAQTHNKWSDRVTAKTLETQPQSPQIG